MFIIFREDISLDEDHQNQLDEISQRLDDLDTAHPIFKRLKRPTVTFDL